MALASLPWSAGKGWLGHERHGAMVGFEAGLMHRLSLGETRVINGEQGLEILLLKTVKFGRIWFLSPGV